MALYAIGDIQGCSSCLRDLIQTIGFNPHQDRLWIAGDLVNRGPDSLGVVRFVREIGASTVLGNHDIHLLAVSAGARSLKVSDTFEDVLSAPDWDEIRQWFLQQSLMLRDDEAGWAMVHAGLVPQWDIEKAWSLALSAQNQLLESGMKRNFFNALYGDTPTKWSERLNGMKRTRFIVNVLTRLRYCDQAGHLHLQHAGPPGTQPKPYVPWFKVWPHRSHRIVFGHWSTLGAKNWGQVVSTDSGCVWGGSLTAVRLAPEPLQFFQVRCS